MNILAFESSCDETAVAVVRDGRTVLSDAILSQADMHALYGGVVPEIASRKHVEAIAGLTDQALRDAGLTKQDIDAVAIPVIDAKVFEMTDALGRRQMDQAFATLGDLFQLRQDPIMILAVLGKHFRQLYTARVALEARQSSRWLMELWGMRSTYPADKLMDMARRHGLDWCRTAMRRCAETDLAMKSVAGADPNDLLVSLMLELAAGGRAC